MDKDEALKQIEIITEAIDSSHQFFMSGPLVMAYGILILLIPALELPTNKLSFDGTLSPLGVALLHVAIYATLFLLTRFIVDRIWVHEVTRASHPLLVKALSFHTPVYVAVCGTVFVLAYTGNINLAGSIVFMMIGILFNIYGRFGHRSLFWFSWSYLILGILFGVFTSPERPFLWIYFNCYLGLSFVGLGFQLRRKKADPWTTLN